jgi:hypothetical protein
MMVSNKKQFAPSSYEFSMLMLDPKNIRATIYAGCHGGLIEAYLRHMGFCNVRYEVNFELIEKGLPLEPSAFLAETDLFIYSPVLNHEGFNTAELAAYCNSNGITTLSFPWIQWNGLHPMTNSAIKLNDFPEYTWWGYQFLVDRSEEFDSLQSFSDFATECIASQVTACADQSLQILRSNEQLTDIRISDFIEEHYKTTLLFHWPSHPTNYLYRFFFERFNAAMQERLPSVLTWPATMFLAESDREHHDCSALPILDCVYDSLNLDPSIINPGFKYRPLFGERLFDTKDFLTMHYRPAEFKSRLA